MNPQNPFDNTHADDQLVELLKESDRQTAVDPNRIASNVLDRIHYRRRGLRRAAGTAVLLALLTAGLIPVLSNSDQTRDQFAKVEPEQPTEEISSETLPEMVGSDSTEEFEERLRWLASAKKLDRLKQELAALDQIEHEQQLVLTRERQSRLLANRTTPSYPVFIGE